MVGVCNKLVLGVTGSVGAALMPAFLALVRSGFAANTHVVMTASARKFLSPYVAHIFSGHEPITDLFDANGEKTVPHIELMADADLLVVMPATANILGKAAHAIADDPVSTTILSARCPVVFVPSMNETLWTHPFVQQNVAKLRTLHTVLTPAKGIEIATLTKTYGALPDFHEVLRKLTETLESEGV